MGGVISKDGGGSRRAGMGGEGKGGGGGSGSTGSGGGSGGPIGEFMGGTTGSVVPDGARGIACEISEGLSTGGVDGGSVPCGRLQAGGASRGDWGAGFARAAVGGGGD